MSHDKVPQEVYMGDSKHEFNAHEKEEHKKHEKKESKEEEREEHC